MICFWISRPVVSTNQKFICFYTTRVRDQILHIYLYFLHLHGLLLFSSLLFSSLLFFLITNTHLFQHTHVPKHYFSNTHNRSVCEVMQAFLDDDDSARKMILATDELDTRSDVAGLEMVRFFLSSLSSFFVFFLCFLFYCCFFE